MRTTMNSQVDQHYRERSVTMTKANLWIVPIARLFFSLIFIVSGFDHFSSGSVSYAAEQGVPLADILVPVSGLLAIIGGLSVLLGIHARMGGLLLLIFLVPVTLIMHNFWMLPGPEPSGTQMAHFMKNCSMIGGALLITFYGAGPVSFDHHRARRKPRT